MQLGNFKRQIAFLNNSTQKGKLLLEKGSSSDHRTNRMVTVKCWSWPNSPKRSWQNHFLLLFRHTVASTIPIFNPAALSLWCVDSAKLKSNQHFTGKELARQGKALLQNNFSSSLIFTTPLIPSAESWTKYPYVCVKPELHPTVLYTLVSRQASRAFPLHQARHLLLASQSMLEWMVSCFLVCSTTDTEKT